jgi:hypothetical protein
MSSRQGHTLARAAAVALAAIAVQFTLVTAYAWPAARLAPRHLPLAVAGPPVAVKAVAGELTRAHPGAFRIIEAGGEAAARGDITGRRAYGAIVVGRPAPVVLTASAASPAVAQLLTQLASQLTKARSPVHDVVPADPHDPHGAAFGAMLLPLVVTSILAGALLTLTVGSAAGRLAGLGLFAAGGGAALAAVARSWLAVLPGDYYVIASMLGLTALAVAATVTGLGSLTARAGRAAAGVGLGAALQFALGNPFSGATSAPELLPAPWGAIGQWLPPGAGATLLRAVEYFGGARSGQPWAVLAGWALGGLALVALSGRRRAARPGPVAAVPTQEPSTAAS